MQQMIPAMATIHCGDHYSPNITIIINILSPLIQSLTISQTRYPINDLLSRNVRRKQKTQPGMEQKLKDIYIYDWSRGEVPAPLSPVYT